MAEKRPRLAVIGLGTMGQAIAGSATSRRHPHRRMEPQCRTNPSPWPIRVLRLRLASRRGQRCRHRHHHGHRRQGCHLDCR